MSKPSLVVGCPTFERAWALPLWFDCIDAQNLSEEFDVTFCFAYSKSYDGTFDILQNRAGEYDEVRIYQFDLPTWPDRDLERIVTLAQLRNGLLDMVKEVQPDYYLSWDDDILFPPGSISHLWEFMSDNDKAVGALMDMGGNDQAMGHPSVMHFSQAPGELAFRRPFNEYNWSQGFACDVIMAVKLMGKEVYNNTRYRWDPVGEDIGWCLDANEKQYQRYIQPRTHGIHLYDKRISLEIMKQFPNVEYPTILGPLARWWTPREEWTDKPWQPHPFA